MNDSNTWIPCELCDEKMKNMTRTIEEFKLATEKQFNMYGEDILYFKKISSQNEAILELLEKIITKEESTNERNVAWYETAIGEFIIKSIVYMIFIILGCAIGINVLDHFPDFQ